MSFSVAGAGAAAPSYTFEGLQNTTISSLSASFTVNLGAPASNRLLVLGLFEQNGNVPTSVTCNGVSLSSVVQSNNIVSIWNGIIPTGTSCTLTFTFTTGIFDDVSISPWVLYNLNSTTAKQTASVAGTSATISVTKGDFLFAINTNGGNFSGSTVDPSPNDRSINGVNPNTTDSADWTIGSTNASFNVVASFSYQVAASYR